MKWICDIEVNGEVSGEFKIFEFKNAYYGRCKLGREWVDKDNNKYYLWIRVIKNSNDKWCYRYNLHLDRINYLEQHYISILRKNKFNRLLNEK